MIIVERVSSLLGGFQSKCISRSASEWYVIVLKSITIIIILYYV